MLALEVIEGPDRGRRFPLPPGEPQLIGRSSEAVPITDTSVSRRHAELTPDGDLWLIRDLHSTNGTDINGQPQAGRTALAVGDIVRCGKTRLQVITLDGIMAGPGASVTPARRAAPELALPTTEQDIRRVLELFWSVATTASDDQRADALAAALVAGLGEHAREDDEANLDVHVRLDDGSRTISIPMASPPTTWQRAAADLAAWLHETTRESARVSQRDRLAAMGETIAIVSHAVKNILQGLQGGAGAIELAINRGDLELAQQGWPILSRNLDRIHDLTFNMLAWSRTSHLDIEPGSLSGLIEDIVSLQRPTFEARRVRLEQAGEPLEDIPFDPGAMHQAILNLVLNALEAVPAKQGVVRIETGRCQEDDRAVIAVVDNGPGIPPPAQHDVFEPFTSSRGQRGTGLGLAVTRRIAAAHGGRLMLRSSEPSGTRFELHLPLHQISGDPGDTDIPPAGSIDRSEFEP